MSYRRDFRSLQKFKADIKKGAQIEQEILRRWLAKEKKHLLVLDNGVDNTGEYIKDVKNLNTEADFYIPDVVGPLEIKFSKKKLQRFFHLKIYQVRSYLEQKCTILMCNGWETPEPEYTIIPCEMLKVRSKEAKEVIWHGYGMKKCFRYNIKDFKWNSL